MDSAGFRYSRRAILRFAAAAGALSLPGSATQDAAFSSVPFADWLAKGDRTDLRWTPHISGSELSIYQRLRVRISIRIDGSEIAARRNHDELVTLIQFASAHGGLYRTHKALDLKKVTADLDAPDVLYNQDTFVLPGDYDVALAVFDKQTSEYSLTQKTIHVSPLRHDPLPDAWRDLSPVEFVQDTDPPDVWFLPAARGRLFLPLETPSPARLTVLVNLTQSERPSRSARGSRRNLEVLIPALRVLSEIAVRNGSLDIVLVDLARRRVAFRQNVVRDLDWRRLKEALTAADPNTIDVRSLEHRRHNAQFFTREVKRLIAAPGERALIALSAPMVFSNGENLRPLHIEPGSACRVFYVRYYPWPRSQLPSPFFEQPGPGRPPAVARFAFRPPFDELAHTLSPLKPRLFDVSNPMQFRKALGEMLREISGL
jgi:hypothetical protein